ncbi:hypothetical protein ACOMHN_065909 [Nucella lapillus]
MTVHTTSSKTMAARVALIPTLLTLTPTLLTLTFTLTLRAVAQPQPQSLGNGSGCEGAVKDLYIMGFFPHSGSWYGGESLQPAVSLTFDQINSMCAVKGYRLHLIPSDTKCDAGLAIYELFQLLAASPVKVAIVGAGCSFVSETLARSSRHWNLVQLSYASISPSLSDKSQFPKFARVSAPETITNPARLRLCQHFGWKRVATISQSLDLFSKTVVDLVLKMEKRNMTVLRSEIFTDDPTLQVRNLMEHDCRIIVGLFYEDNARKVFCEAYKLGLYGRRVVWLLNGWYEHEWWRQPDNAITCTPEEMDRAVEGYLDVSIVYLNPKSEPTVSGWLPADFVKAFEARMKNQTLFGEKLAPQGYDAAWALALALNNTRHQLEGSGKGLEDFSYNDTHLSDLLYSNLLNVSFMGVRGPISFDANGDPVGIVKIGRVQGETPVVSARACGNNNSNNNNGGSPPRDSTVKVSVQETLSVPLYVAMCLLAALGIGLALLFLAFNIALRNVRLVKMSSPRVNNVILLGCICAYTSVILQDAGAGQGTFGCELKTGLLVLGISLTFGALFAKTWRVHIIFTNTTLQKTTMSDGKLMAMVGALVVVNMIVMVTWWVKDPRTVQVTSVTSAMVADSAGEVVVEYQEKSCVSDNQIYFLGTLYGIHALLLLMGTFLAFETRNVHYPALNDSKHIGMCIYNVALLSIPAVVLSVALDPKMDLKFAIGSSLVLLGTTATQCILFVPKVGS